MTLRWIVVGIVVTLGLAALVEAGSTPKVVEVVAGSAQDEFTFAPKQITLQAGQPVTLTLINKGKIEHDVAVDGLRLRVPASEGQLVAPGKRASVTFVPTKKGTFEFACSVPGHKEAGMTGVIIVK